VKCFTCGNVKHKSYECLYRKKEGGETHISKDEGWNIEVEDAEGGRSLIIRKVLLMLKKEEENPAQRNSLLQTACKRTSGKCH
jgi:hypothetical protein